MNKSRTQRYTILLLLAFVVDSVLQYYLPYNFSKNTIVFIPSITYVMFTLLNNTIDPEFRYMFASAMGLIYSMVYGQNSGIYILIFCLIAFIGQMYMKKGSYSIMEAFVMVGVSLLIKEGIVYLYRLFMHDSNQFILSFIQYRLLPTVLGNLVLFFVVYYIYDYFKIELTMVDFLGEMELK